MKLNYNFVPMREFNFENEGVPTIIRAPESLTGSGYEKTHLCNHAEHISMFTTKFACELGCKMHIVIRAPELYDDEHDAEPEEYSVERLEEELAREGMGWFIVVKDGQYKPLLG